MPYQQGTMPATVALEQYRQPYLQYAIAQQQAGQEPIPFEQWAGQQYQASAQAAPAPQQGAQGGGFMHNMNTLANLMLGRR